MASRPGEIIDGLGERQFTQRTVRGTVASDLGVGRASELDDLGVIEQAPIRLQVRVVQERQLSIGKGFEHSELAGPGGARQIVLEALPVPRTKGTEATHERTTIDLDGIGRLQGR